MPTTCIATLSVTGAPYRIIGGTGAYTGATGGGTFSASGVIVFDRTANGRSEQPRIFFADVRLSGTISLP